MSSKYDRMSLFLKNCGSKFKAGTTFIQKASHFLEMDGMEKLIARQILS